MRVIAALLLLVGCQDLHDFQGDWRGSISADPNLSAGAPVQTVNLTVASVDHTQITGTFNGSTLTTLKGASADVLAEVRVGRDALRTYFTYAEGVWAIVSLFPDQRIEVRVIAGDSLYLYDLRRL